MATRTTAPDDRAARIAGFMLLFVIAAYMTGEFLVSGLLVAGDPAGTAGNVSGAEATYRIGRACQFVSIAGTAVLAWALYRLLQPVNRQLAQLAFAWRLCEVSTGGVVAIGSFFALYLLGSQEYLAVFDSRQLQAAFSLLLRVNAVGFHVGAIFFGLASTVFFCLFLGSGLIPKLLSAWGVFASLLVLVVSFGSLLQPQWSGVLGLGWLPMFVAEIAVGAWLLIRGARGAATRESVRHPG